MTERSYPPEFHELMAYTLQHPDQDNFIHQHAVDAFHAQNADHNTKSIELIFALVGLFLYLERGYTGKRVQQAHAQLSKKKITWPSIEIPSKSAVIKVEHVIKSKEGSLRDEMIRNWCVTVWNLYRNSHIQIENLIKSTLEV